MRRSSIVATRRAEGLPKPKIDMRGYMNRYSFNSG